ARRQSSDGLDRDHRARDAPVCDERRPGIPGARQEGGGRRDSARSCINDLSAMAPRYPSLFQINTRVWVTELSRSLGRPATLDDLPDAEIDRLALLGFDWVWLLSVWQTGPAA